MSDFIWAMIGALVLGGMWGLLAGEAAKVRDEVCTLAFSHAETRLDSLEVTVTYDYCELPGDDDGE